MALLEHRDESEFALKRDIVFEAICQAVHRSKGMKLKSADKITGYILVKTGMTWWSWGENISIQLTAISESRSRLHITSRGGEFDTSKNRKNIERIISETSRILDSHHRSHEKLESPLAPKVEKKEISNDETKMNPAEHVVDSSIYPSEPNSQIPLPPEKTTSKNHEVPEAFYDPLLSRTKRKRRNNIWGKECSKCSNTGQESLDILKSNLTYTFNNNYALILWTPYNEVFKSLCSVCFFNEYKEIAIHSHEHYYVDDAWNESMVTLKWKSIATFLKGIPLYSRSSTDTKHIDNDLLLKIECHSNIPKVIIDLKNNLGKKLEASLLFDNDSISTLSLERRANREHYQATLSTELLKNFQKLNLVKWKFTSQNKDIVWSGSFKQNEKSLVLFKQEDYQEALKSYANEFDNVLSKKSASWKENLLEENKPSISDPEVADILEECHVYLMKDTSNGFYKIGVSNKPEYRERTLQSEKPTIELITSKSYPSREMALAIEKAMHNLFEKKRLRGEWFKLSSSDVNQVKESLK